MKRRRNNEQNEREWQAKQEINGQSNQELKSHQESPRSRELRTLIWFCCLVFFLRLLQWWSERHHSVCSLFPAGQWQRRLPWNNAEPLPVSVTLSWLMYTFDPPFTLSAYFTQPPFLIFYQPSIHSSNFIKEIHPSGYNDYNLTKTLMIVLSSLACLAKRLISKDWFFSLFSNNTEHVILT